MRKIAQTAIAEVTGLAPEAVALLQRKPTRLFSKRYPGAAHPLTVLVEMTARHMFFIAKAFSLSGSKQYKKQHSIIGLSGTRACNELSSLHLAMEETATEEYPGEWPVFKNYTIAQPSGKKHPQLLISALSRQTYFLCEYLSSPGKLTKNWVAIRFCSIMALGELRLIERELDRIRQVSGWMAQWPTPCTKRRAAA